MGSHSIVWLLCVLCLCPASAGASKDISALLDSAEPVPAPPLAAARPENGPNLSGINLNLKSHRYAFTARYQFALDGGVIYMRKPADPGWTKVPDQPAGTVSISADGKNLIALSADGSVGYFKTPNLKWKKGWGKPVGKTLKLPPNRAWAVSNLSDDAQGFEDPAGHFKPTPLGVSSLYVLSPDGRRLNYADPWLPPNFGHRISMPQRGRFIAESMDASGSTIFLINKAGQMYTRLADFDSTGADPLFAYSFTKHTQKVIALPGEGWREQPRINGAITAHITIFTNGRGNAGRELRVEGVDAQGNGGYYRKLIYGAQWEFVRTGAAVAGPFLGGAAELGPELDADYPVSFPGLLHPRLPDGTIITFSPENDIAYLKIPVDAGTVELPLYVREGFTATRKGMPNLLGSIVVPDDILGSQDPATAALVKKHLRDKVIDVRIVFDGKTVQLRSAPWRAIREGLAQKNHAAKK